MIQKTMKQNQKGLTLIEVLIGLAIFAVIVAGVLAFFGGVQRSANLNTEASNLSAIYNSISQYYTKGRTAGLNNELALQGGFVPQSMTVDLPDTIYNAFGGAVHITDDGADVRAFAVEYTRIPVVSCSAFIQTQVRTGWDGVAVDVTASSPNASVVTAASDLFRSSNGAVGGLTRGNEELQENRIIAICNDAAAGAEYVNIKFFRDSQL